MLIQFLNPVSFSTRAARGDTRPPGNNEPVAFSYALLKYLTTFCIRGLRRYMEQQWRIAHLRWRGLRGLRPSAPV